MNGNSALVFDFSSFQRPFRRVADRLPRVHLAEALQRVERCSQWLAAHQTEVMGFIGSTLHEPVVIVAAHPNVWQLFTGRAHNKGHRQDGALRYAVWEGWDRLNNVTVRWEEVSACAS